MTTFTIIGAEGFIGSGLRSRLEGKGEMVVAPGREDATWVRSGDDLGHVLYCAGLTTDALDRPDDALRAHFGLVGEALEHARFDSFLYLSSTRVYAHATSGAEDAELSLDPDNLDDFFAVTKLEGENLCRSADRPNVRIARLSNVYGVEPNATFLASIVSDAITSGEVTLKTALDSEKDYVSLTDVCDILPRIALDGTQDRYNVASGVNVTNRALIERLAEITNCTWQVADDAPVRSFPTIQTTRLQEGFAWEPSSVLDDLSWVVSEFPG